jgi:hypothetical protein
MFVLCLLYKDSSMEHKWHEGRKNLKAQNGSKGGKKNHGLVYVGFVVDKVALGQVFLQVLRFSSVIIIPPMLHTHSFIYHQRCIMFLSQYFSFPLSISFHRFSITWKNKKKLIIYLIIFITGLQNKPQSCDASVASAAGPFSKKKKGQN